MIEGGFLYYIISTILRTVQYETFPYDAYNHEAELVDIQRP